jgi:DNA modification methylase
MQENMIEAMKKNIEGFGLSNLEVTGEKVENEWFKVIHGDAIKEVGRLDANSIDISIYSPPFSSLYTYSDSIEDLSNCKSHEEFYNHFRFLVKDLLRVTKPGRLTCLHLTQLTTMKGTDGFFSIIDFRGDVIRLFQSEGWIFHAETTIWKDPEMAAIRTKATQLMHGTTKRDATDVRPGLADYLVCFRKPGENLDAVNYGGDGLPFDLWCQYASPVWMDVNASDTLQFMSGKDDDDVKHITPTQLEVWKRCLALWSNPGDTVLTPFMGIGSEVWQAVKMGRKAIGIELKKSYFDQAVRNLQEVLDEKKQGALF